MQEGEEGFRPEANFTMWRYVKLPSWLKLSRERGHPARNGKIMLGEAHEET